MQFKSGWKRLSALAMGLCLTASVAAPSFAVNIREGSYKDGTTNEAIAMVATIIIIGAPISPAVTAASPMTSAPF